MKFTPITLGLIRKTMCYPAFYRPLHEFIGFRKPGSLQHYLQTTGKDSEGVRWQRPLSMKKVKL